MATRTALSQVALPAAPAAAAEASTKNYVDTTTIPLSARAAADGVAPLNSGVLVPIAYLPAAGASDYPAAIGAFNDPGTSTLLARNDHAHSGVALSGDQTIAGIKTFSSSPIVPTPTTSTQAATKAYADLMVPLTQRAAASGVATLDSGTKIPIAQIPTGTSSTTVVIGDDTRLSSARHIVGGKRRTSNASATSGTTELQILDTGSLNLEASSAYLVRAWIAWTPSVVNDDFDVRIRNTNTSGALRAEGVAPRALGTFPYHYLIEYLHITTSAETGSSFIASLQRVGGSGTATANAGSYITVQYVGTSSLLGTL